MLAEAEKEYKLRLKARKKKIKEYQNTVREVLHGYNGYNDNTDTIIEEFMFGDELKNYGCWCLDDVL